MSWLFPTARRAAAALSTFEPPPRGSSPASSARGLLLKTREGLLPRQGPGYYQEFEHPTPGVSGVGPQRIVRGQGGELYYTPDHYKTFTPLN